MILLLNQLLIAVLVYSPVVSNMLVLSVNVLDSVEVATYTIQLKEYEKKRKKEFLT